MTPTPIQLEKALLALSKDNLLGLTDTDISSVMTVLNKYAMYSHEKVASNTKDFLFDLYCRIEYGVNKISLLPESSNRSFQLNGTQSERFAIDILSAIDGVQYEKNRDRYENDFFIGKPDIMLPNEVKEIKTVCNLAKFLSIGMSKEPKGSQFQLQSYFDLLDFDSGEIVYVLVGLNGTERDRYLEFAREKYASEGWSASEIGKMLIKLEKNCDFDYFPHEKRVIRRQFKRNPYMIRLARKKVTAARAFLAKIDAKFNKNVVLSDDTQSGEDKNV